MQDQIKQLLTKILVDMNVSDVIPQVSLSSSSDHGEFSSNVAMLLAKKIDKSPMEIAEEIKQKLITHKPADNLLEKIVVVKPGFVNIYVNRAFLVSQLKYLLEGQEKIDGKGKSYKYIVEYSSPNIAKPFTVGHLRSTIIGDAIANLLEATGNKVYRDNHLGDWGTQFGKQIYAIKTWGNEAEMDASENPVKDLVALYVRFHDEAEKNPSLEDEGRAWFKKLEDGDPEARRLWKKCIDWSWKEFNRIYSELNVEFTENEGRGFGEAYFEDKMQSVIEELKAKKLLHVGEQGAQIVEFPSDFKLPPLMILKKDGATLYSTRDLATDKFRLEHYGKAIIIINEVGGEQSLYFRQLYKLEEMLGWFYPEQRMHKKHGLYRFQEGKMSTRKGNVIWLEDVLDEAKKRAYNLQFDNISYPNDEIKEKVQNTIQLGKGEKTEIEDRAKAVAIGAIKWNDLKRNSEQDILFDWDDILNMHGNSGPYMQYVYVRCLSILEKAKSNTLDVEGQDVQERISDFEGYTFKSEEFELLRQLCFFETILKQAAKELAPHMLCTYLFELAQVFNHFYQKVPVLHAENETQKKFRLLLVSVTAKVIKKGLHILGMETPEKM